LIHVVHNRRIDIRNGPVIGETTAVPIAAVKTTAGVAKAVVNAAIKADMIAPISAMPAIAASIEVPVRRRP
jgi:hypothetical protein